MNIPLLMYPCALSLQVLPTPIPRVVTPPLSIVLSQTRTPFGESQTALL